MRFLDPNQLRLCAISDRRLVVPSVGVLEALTNAGLTAFFLREKDLRPMELYRLAKPLAEHARSRGLFFGVHGSLELGLALKADAVHLGYDALPLEVVVPLAKGKLWIGRSCHNRQDLVQAMELGADYATLSPIFPPSSKTADLPCLGLAGLRANTDLALPIVALGGILASNVGDCLRAGAVGVAAIGPFFQAEDLQAATLSFAHALAGV